MLKLNTMSLCKKELFSVFHSYNDIPKIINKMLKVVGNNKIESIEIDLKFNFVKMFYLI